MRLLIILAFLFFSDSAIAQDFEEIEFRSIDGLTVTADLYETGDRSDPILVLFPQSASSRGEYRTTAPVFVENGFNVLAVDTRWGNQDFWNFVPNKTAARYGTKAIMDEVDAGDRSRLWPTIMSSYQDMVSALDWIYMNDFSGPQIVGGSSASALLVFQMHRDRQIDGVLAFSPGEYHDDDSTLVRQWVSDLAVPAFVAAGVDEAEMTQPIFDAIPVAAKTHYVAEVGAHGGSILFQDDRNMQATLDFLSIFKPSEVVAMTTSDDVTVHGDWYLTDPQAPTIMLFHQGASNARSEYAPHVPRLLHAGYNVLMTDQRRGGSRFGGVNRTLEGVGETEYSYCDVQPDLVAALRFAESRTSGKIIAWGSSYSSTLSLQLAADEPSVDAVLAFSPASGDPMGECQPLEPSRLLEVPIMVLRPPRELQLDFVAEQWTAFEEMRDDSDIEMFVPLAGVHGSSMLNPSRVQANVEPTWNRVLSFLDRVSRD